MFRARSAPAWITLVGLIAVTPAAFAQFDFLQDLAEQVGEVTPNPADQPSLDEPQASGPPPHAPPVITIARGERSAFGLDIPGFSGADLIIRSPQVWQAFWAAHTGPDGTLPPPPVDFRDRVVIASILGPQDTSGGPNVAIIDVQRGVLGARIVVFDDRRPGDLDQPSNPFHIVSVARPLTGEHGSGAFIHVHPMPGTSVVQGRVATATDNADHPARPVPGARVILADANRPDPAGDATFTGLDGSYFFVNVPAGPYALHAGKPGFLPQTKDVPVPPAVTLNVPFLLEREQQTGGVRGVVLAANGPNQPPAPLAGATVQLVRPNEVIAETTSGDNGGYGFMDVEPGLYGLRATADGYLARVIPIEIRPGQPLQQNIVLMPE